MPTRYRLPLLVLDATGMRLDELEQLTWGEVDEQRGRRRVTQAVLKTSTPGWVQVPRALFAAVCGSLRLTTERPSGASSRGSAATASGQ